VAEGRTNEVDGQAGRRRKSPPWVDSYFRILTWEVASRRLISDTNKNVIYAEARARRRQGLRRVWNLG
jgi:hypothetical protein